MNFNVVIGNPPYQMTDGTGGNGSSAKPLYHLFIQEAKKLNPKCLSMIIPARWYSGGKGLDSFRNEMLNDKRIKKLVDYPNASDCFPQVDLKGGVCYFLWLKNYKGDCEVTTNKTNSTMKRPLLEFGTNTFIRHNEAISIYNKVKTLKEESMNTIVNVRKPFGFKSSFKGQKNKSTLMNPVKIYITKDESFVEKNEIKKNKHLVNKNKVYISKAYGASENYPHQILNKPFVGDKNTCCNETYLVIGNFNNKSDAENLKKYIETKFFRFMVHLKKNTQNTCAKTYSYVPIQDFTEEWTDEKLYAKYGLTDEEIEFIESLIKPMKE